MLLINFASTYEGLLDYSGGPQPFKMLGKTDEDIDSNIFFVECFSCKVYEYIQLFGYITNIAWIFPTKGTVRMD